MRNAWKLKRCKVPIGDVIQAQNAIKAERARRASVATKGVQSAVKSQASYTAARENLKRLYEW